MPAVPGVTQDSGLLLQGTGASLPSLSVGQKTVAPTVKKPTNTTSTPASIDLSGTYGKSANGTIYNTKTNTAFSKPADFFTDSGQKSFDNLKFANYTPTGKETVYGSQPVQASVSISQPTQGILPALAANTPTPTPTPTPTTATGAPATPPPPNNGATGVSQGTIIGGQIANASNNPLFQQAQQKYNDLSGQIAALQSNLAKQTSNLEGSPIDLSLATGQEGILNRLAAAKQAALGTQQQAAQQAATNAISEQGATNTGLSSAGALNAPITGVAYGTQTIQPSQPNGNTASGAANISQLVGSGNGSNGHPAGEYFNTQTGKGFSTPQELSDFINSQVQGANTTPQNVFQYLQQQSTQGNQNGGALNPLNNIQTTAQKVVNGELSYPDALSAGGNVATYTNALQQAISSIQPGFNFNTSQGNSSAQQATTAKQQQLQQDYTSAKQQATNLTSQFTNLLSTYGLNPQELNVANGVLQTIAKNTSDWRYSALQNYVTDIASTYATILGATGTVTDNVRDTAQGMLDSLASGQSMTNTISVLDQQAQAKIAGVQTAPITSNKGVGYGSGGLYDF